jgi:hypothetical protein
VSPLSLRSIPENLDTLLPTQWPLGARRGRHARGWPALAAAVLTDACRCAGLMPMRRRVRLAVRRAAWDYLLGQGGDEPLPLELACALVDVDPAVLHTRMRDYLHTQFRECLVPPAPDGSDDASAVGRR